MTRRYRLGKRAVAAAVTRRRIVEAALELHDRQGISSTSLRGVARHAGISPATILNHFPRMSDLIQACGQLSTDMLPMPTEAVLVGARGVQERIRLFALAMFEWWQQMGPGWDHLQVDRRTIPEVDSWLRDVDRGHRLLASAALGPSASAAAVTMLTAMTTNGAWRSLHDAGLSAAEAAGQVTRACTGSLRVPLPSASKPARRTH